MIYFCRSSSDARLHQGNYNDAVFNFRCSTGTRQVLSPRHTAQILMIIKETLAFASGEIGNDYYGPVHWRILVRPAMCSTRVIMQMTPPLAADNPCSLMCTLNIQPLPVPI